MNVFDDYCDYDRLEDVGCINWVNDGLKVVDVNYDDVSCSVFYHMNDMTIDDLDILSGYSLPNSYSNYIENNFNSSDQKGELVKVATEINQLIEYVIGQTERFIADDLKKDFCDWYSREFGFDSPDVHFSAEVRNISYFTTDEIEELRENYQNNK